MSASGSFRDLAVIQQDWASLFVFCFVFHLLSFLRGWFILHQAFVNPFDVSMIFSNLKKKRKEKVEMGSNLHNMNGIMSNDCTGGMDHTSSSKFDKRTEV